MPMLERLPDAERYEIAAYFVYGALPANKHVAGKCGPVNWSDGWRSMLRGKLNRLALRAIMRKALRQSDAQIRLPQGRLVAAGGNCRLGV